MFQVKGLLRYMTTYECTMETSCWLKGEFVSNGEPIAATRVGG